jgi:Protein of unknown function (DUF2939)
MRWTLGITLVLLLLLAAYTVSPLIGLYRIGLAVEARNATALAERVDFRSLRRSLVQQVVAEYLKLTGKGKSLGRFGAGIATGVGASVAEPLIAEFLNAEALLEFLTKGTTNVGAREGGTVSVEGPPLLSASWRSAWQTWWHSEYLGKDFYVHVPIEKPKRDQFRVRLSLRGWQWKLTGIDLPDTLRVELANELIRREDRLSSLPLRLAARAVTSTHEIEAT